LPENVLSLDDIFYVSPESYKGMQAFMETEGIMLPFCALRKNEKCLVDDDKYSKTFYSFRRELKEGEYNPDEFTGLVAACSLYSAHNELVDFNKENKELILSYILQLGTQVKRINNDGNKEWVNMEYKDAKKIVEDVFKLYSDYLDSGYPYQVIKTCYDHTIRDDDWIYFPEKWSCDDIRIYNDRIKEVQYYKDKQTREDSIRTSHLAMKEEL